MTVTFLLAALSVFRYYIPNWIFCLTFTFVTFKLILSYFRYSVRFRFV